MAHVSTKLPLSLIYPTWAALGTAGAVIGAMVMFGERLTAQQVAAIVVIIVGVALLHGPSLFNRG
jgi:multidrug transporter EmrE-like cation transporter